MPPHQEASVEATLAALEALGGLLEGSGSTPAPANAAFAAIAAPAAPMQLPADRADRAAPATGQRGVPVESGGHKVPERQEAAAATVTKMLVPDTIEVEEVPVTISRPITPAPKEGCLDRHPDWPSAWEVVWRANEIRIPTARLRDKVIIL